MAVLNKLFDAGSIESRLNFQAVTGDLTLTTSSDSGLTYRRDTTSNATVTLPEDPDTGWWGFFINGTSGGTPGYKIILAGSDTFRDAGGTAGRTYCESNVPGLNCIFIYLGGNIWMRDALGPWTVA